MRHATAVAYHTGWWGQMCRARQAQPCLAADNILNTNVSNTVYDIESNKSRNKLSLFQLTTCLNISYSIVQCISSVYQTPCVPSVGCTSLLFVCRESLICGCCCGRLCQSWTWQKWQHSADNIITVRIDIRPIGITQFATSSPSSMLSFTPEWITSCTVGPVLTATGFVNGRWQFSPPPPQNPHPLTDHQKFVASDYVCECATFDANPSTGGFWANGWNIT